MRERKKERERERETESGVNEEVLDDKRNERDGEITRQREMEIGVKGRRGVRGRRQRYSNVQHVKKRRGHNR